MPQARPARLEHLRGRGQARRQRDAVQADTWGDVLGGGDSAPGLELLAAQQVGNRLDRGLVATLGEHAAPRQGGDDADGGPLQPPGRALARPQHGQQLVVRSGEGLRRGA